MAIFIRFLLPIGVVCGLMACDDKTFFEKKQAIPGGVWMYRDSVDFRFTVSDTTELYNMYVDFEHADTFPNQNVYLKLYTRFPDGKRLSRSRSFDLFDAQGASAGSCSGGTCQVHSLLQNNAYFNRPGEYVITLQQFMRSDSLPGIRSVGLVIEKAEKKRGGEGH